MKFRDSTTPAERRLLYSAIAIPLALSLNGAILGRVEEAALLLGVVGLCAFLFGRLARTRARLAREIGNAQQIAHDIRSPLTVIGILASGAKTPEESVALYEATSRVL